MDLDGQTCTGNTFTTVGPYCYLLKNDFFFNVYECLPACVYMHHIYGLVPSETTKKVLDPQELELQMVVSHS